MALVDTPVDIIDFTDAELAELSRRVRAAAGHEDHPVGGRQRSRPHLGLTASMTDAVLIDLAVKVDPAIEVVFIDTGYHFPETLETVEEVRRHYGLNLRIMTVARQDEELWKVDPENCCSAVKVGQLDRALAGKAAWMSGLRRTEAATRGRRRSSPATCGAWSRSTRSPPGPTRTCAGYIEDHDVPVNPLIARRATRRSAACRAPRRSLDGEDPRSGRWAGRDKTECGLHLA